MAKRRIALFGGSFDPPHWGHFLLACDAREKFALDEVVFLPAARSPLKENSPIASGEDRLHWLETAIAGRSGLRVSDWELRQSGPSYSIETVRHWQTIEPTAELFWIIGADQALSLPKWHRIEELLQQISFIVFPRPGQPELSEETLPYSGSLFLLPGHHVNLSSSEIRERLRERKSLHFLVPENIRSYLEDYSLYQKPSIH
ncbi:MAG: nicotinate (nicotinamide) nucleotide adenylyltransferase [Opitutales bacterium]|nr:nicotinate (nicotinamide) nucleotide adenylyltransferase [Opitutales bacterium]MCH8539277.1 nicotinate (nicotinamide) nucleotide adenylyltransferase [Opitutales bacterium]